MFGVSGCVWVCMCGGGGKGCVYVCLLVACGFNMLGIFLLILYVVFWCGFVCTSTCGMPLG